MSNNNVVYERDLLYPTDSIFEPGSVHVEVLNPNKKGKMPVVIESKTTHSPIKFISSILRVMQSDIFDRILVDLKNNVNLYIRSNDEIKKIYDNKNYVLVTFKDENIEYKGIDEIEL